MKGILRNASALTPLVLAFFDIWPSATCANDIGNPLLSNAPGVIGANAPLCTDDFARQNPPLEADLRVVSESALRIECYTAAKGTFVGTAVYVDTPSKRIVITAEHTFSKYRFDIQSQSFKYSGTVPPSSCSLTTVKNEILNFDPAINGIMGHPVDKVSLDGTADWAVLALDKIPNIAPIKLSRLSPLTNDQHLLRMGVTGYADGGRDRCPTATACRMHKAIIIAGHAPFYKTDCSASPGASGGPIAVTQYGKPPSLAAIYTGDGIRLPSGSPFDADKMYAIGIGVSGPFLRSIREVDALAQRARLAR